MIALTVLGLLTVACKNKENPMVDDATIPQTEAPVIYSQPTTNAISLNETTCLSNGWKLSYFKVDGIERKVISKGPAIWSKGAIVILHGGGGTSSDFCSGGPLVTPQIEFTTLAINQGFSVFLLDSTTDIVTDAQGRTCGKRFDFSVLNRNNIDLPYIEFVLTTLIPLNRVSTSNSSVFVTGLSTGGYMTTRASTHFGSLINAFAPVSAGDPYGTDTICDRSLSDRESAVGILVDRETSQQIIKDQACESYSNYPNESKWSGQSEINKPVVKQFHHTDDGIVDISCFTKVNRLLIQNGYQVQSPFLLPSLGKKDPMLHLWLRSYNQPILDFFTSQLNN